MKPTSLINYLAVLFLLAIIVSCNKHNNRTSSYAPYTTTAIPFSVDSINIEGDLEGFTLDLSSTAIEPNLDIITVTLTSDHAATPPRVTLTWAFPSIDIAKFWNPKLEVDKATYYRNNTSSRSTKLAPVNCVMNQNDENRFTVAVADALNPINLGAWIKEEDAQMHYYITFFSERYPAITRYETTILVDRRRKPYGESLADVTSWWASQEGYTPATTPKEALRPMYSTWYSYHQNLDVATIIEECRESKKMGIEAVIVDDGWQTLDSKRGYAYTGDWKPERIPEMRAFVDSIHALEMQFLLWYSVPFIGKNAENYPLFKGKYLYFWESQGAWVLDPRYPEVREFIISIYEKAIEEWGLDGFKLDFMAFFSANNETVLTAEEGRDFASVNHAVDQLMTDIMSRLREKNPAILIEFRQPYIGPLMRKYGNMLRAADCPNMATINRVRTTDIRLLAGNSAVHADMLMWHPDEPVEHAALQILNILFSVPQISVRLNEIPQEQKDMVAFWMRYWNENQHLLMKGKFVASKPDLLYPLLSVTSEEKTIFGLYGDDIIPTENLQPGDEIDVINARNNTTIILLNDQNLGHYKAEIFTCKGEKVAERDINMKAGAVVIDVPASGLVKLK